MTPTSFICPHCDVEYEGCIDRCASCRKELVIRGRYRVVRLLSRQGPETRYQAADESSATQVLLVLFDESKGKGRSQADRFDAQARLLRRLEHPGVLRIQDDFQTSIEGAWVRGQVYPWIQAESLAQRLERSQRLIPAEAKRLLAGLLGTLEYLHGRFPPVIHGNINPFAILLPPDAPPVLRDFNTALDTFVIGVGDDPEGEITGPHVPPEQKQGKAVPASDLYALGMTLLAGLAGRKLEALPPVTEQFDLASLVGPAQPLVSILSRLIQPDLSKRFASAADVWKVLGPYVPVESAGAPSLESSRTGWPSERTSATGGGTGAPEVSGFELDLRMSTSAEEGAGHIEKLTLDWPEGAATVTTEPAFSPRVDRSSAAAPPQPAPSEALDAAPASVSGELFGQASPARSRQPLTEPDAGADPYAPADPLQKLLDQLKDETLSGGRTRQTSPGPMPPPVPTPVPQTRVAFATAEALRANREASGRPSGAQPVKVSVTRTPIGQTEPRRKFREAVGQPILVQPARRSGCLWRPVITSTVVFMLVGLGVMVYVFQQASQESKERGNIDVSIGSSVVRSWNPFAQELGQLPVVWSNAVDGFSSQSGDFEGAAGQVLGLPDVYPRHGDEPRAWSPSAEDRGHEYITVLFAPPVEASAVVVVETFNPDAIIRIDDLSDPSRELELWQHGQPPKRTDTSRIILVRLSSPRYISRLRLVLDTARTPGFNQIDAIGVIPASADIDIFTL